MPSTLSWIDFDSEAQQRTQRILSLFKERDTRDELGFGPIRDAISDTLFPGTSTLHTRLRYMLFIPWLYTSLEAKGVSSQKIRERARWEQIHLSAVLKKNAPTDVGIIGGEIGDKLKTLPSAIYWAGLSRWGVRAFPGTEGQYHQALDEIYFRRKKSKASVSAAAEDGDDIGGLWELGAHSFHPGVPTAPVGFPENVTFELTKPEARYLQERLRQSCPDSLLADLMANPMEVTAASPWEHPLFADFQTEHQSLLRHGRNFSTIAYGAAVLYNQMISELRRDEALLAEHREAGRVWLEKIETEFGDIIRWANRMSAFWSSVMNHGHDIPDSTVVFVKQWVELLIEYRGGIFDKSSAKKLIREREIEKKRNNSRFTNSRVRDQWGGSSGLEPMTYRWKIAQSHIADMAVAIGPHS